MAPTGLLPGVAFITKDLEGRFVMLNRRACDECHVCSLTHN